MKLPEINEVVEREMFRDEMNQYVVTGDLTRFLHNLGNVSELSSDDFRAVTVNLEQLSARETSTSPYYDLYESIEKMRLHGLDIGDFHVVLLATQLKYDLAQFEDGPNNTNKEVKNEFKIKFLASLHSQDGRFSKQQDNPIKQFLGTIYKNLYTKLFDKDKFVAFTFFSKDRKASEIDTMAELKLKPKN